MLALLVSIFTATAMATTTPIITPPATINLETVREVRVEPQAELTERELIIKKINQTFGKDAPTMLAIGECESGLRQTYNGEILTSKTGDSGVFQINQVHNKRLAELKLDPHKLDDNIAYAKILYDENKFSDWGYSKHCWSAKIK